MLTREEELRISRTTVTSLNAMTDAEVDAFLSQKHVARLGTQRADGDVHVTPIWYVWEDGKFKFLLSDRRLHVKNMLRVPRATVCVDEDLRLTGSLAAGAQAVMIRGPVEISDDPAQRDDMYRKLGKNYLGVPDEMWDDPGFVALRESERRLVFTLTPESVVAWDFSKV